MLAGDMERGGTIVHSQVHLCTPIQEQTRHCLMTRIASDKERGDTIVLSQVHLCTPIQEQT
eukprot:CAMPEP_0185564320 /NCGR_PEP_ID=MMETSP1381-20130426/65045_1 /TAXON_ID=298111 /ORGANISM="Pavlova sp., Strain CCMP459" /LENGTH=60 /DNA_ID=CAMNT_0028178255 /DNA_START=550 /DNA_END=729 /DNA_ORIENTATION=-